MALFRCTSGRSAAADYDSFTANSYSTNTFNGGYNINGVSDKYTTGSSQTIAPSGLFGSFVTNTGVFTYNTPGTYLEIISTPTDYSSQVVSRASNDTVTNEPNTATLKSMTIIKLS